MKRKRMVDMRCIGIERLVESNADARFAFISGVFERDPRYSGRLVIVGQNQGVLQISKETGEVSLVEAMPGDHGNKRFQRAAACVRKHWEDRKCPYRTIIGVPRMDRINKAFWGKDAKTKRKYNAIFNAGFKSGARARVKAGLVQPPGSFPRRSANIPPTYSTRDERAVWSGGYRMGYAIGTP